MVDIDTHRIIDLLPSREVDDVAQWLSSFPNLEIVSRDGSVSYNSAVKQADEGSTMRPMKKRKRRWKRSGN